MSNTRTRKANQPREDPRQGKHEEATRTVDMLFRLVQMESITGESIVRLNSKEGQVLKVSWGVDAKGSGGK